MSTCYVGTSASISPYGAGGAENLIRRRKEKSGAQKYYFLTDFDEYQLILPDGSLRKFRPNVIAFLYFLLMYRNKFYFSPVALKYNLRVLLNIFHLLRIIKIERIIFNYPSNSWKLKLYFMEALLFSNKIFYLSNRQYVELKRHQRFSPFVACKYIVKEKIEIPSYFKFNYADKKGFVVSFIGRPDINKGIEEVIEIAELLKVYPNITLNICYLSGYTGLDKSLVSRINLLGKQNNMNILLSLKNETDMIKNEHKVSELLKASHVFLQPYKYLNSAIEAPLLLYEAKEADCIIFTRNVDGIGEHLSGKFRFFSGDAKNFAKCAVAEMEKLRLNQHE